MEANRYRDYISSETMMGPNCVVILEELLNKYPLKVGTDDLVLDLGCGKGLSSLVIAKETGAKVYAVDLWITEQENWKRFSEWSIDDKVTPICEDANNLRFEERIFSAMISIDSYHYFGGEVGFFQEKILPLLKDGG
ncbi:Methyltransferase domain-containing protein [Fervidobacterium changbaicum]|uniref:Methyltransferase domain-containing protein n=1 Tax=Fervidobacterium islandicum TaxID=2423 RepID=A0AAJ5HNU5_FERIS|nr:MULTISPECIES: methyltransferase domain-containing protein [Fervidobacterium]UOE96831.1 methyltransferase domain-containing protein [Fervidobacterium islandicum]SDH24501.1 Methyltransferase domain-containing protein [Fervidobacterium changbaicum]